MNESRSSGAAPVRSAPCRRLRHAARAVLALLLVVPTFGWAAEGSGDEDLGLLVELIAQQEDANFQLDLLRGMRDGLAGRGQVAAPPGWDALYQSLQKKLDAAPELGPVVDELALMFGDRRVAEQLVERLRDSKLPADQRRGLLKILGSWHDPMLVPVYLDLLQASALRDIVIRYLARYDDPRIAPALLAVYTQLDSQQKQDAILTLASRKQAALQLLDAIVQGVVPRRDVSAFVARQLADLDPAVRARLEEVWGAARATPAEKREQWQRYRELIETESGPEPDLGNGRAVFARTCQKCHKLFGEGETIGPDLTGTNRVSLDYLLENILDPNALIGKDYQLYTVVMDDGRLISGILVGQDQQTIRLQTVNEQLIVSRDEIELMEQSPKSMMPEGQLESLTESEVRDLIAYLQSPRQVPLPVGGEVASDGRVPPESQGLARPQPPAAQDRPAGTVR